MEDIFEYDDISLSDEDNEEPSIWNIKFEDELRFWEKNLIDIYTYQPKNCPLFKKGEFNIRKNPKQNILNPYLVVCNNKICKKKSYLRQYSFFGKNKKIPASIIAYIIYNFTVLKLNAIQINLSLENKYKKNNIFSRYTKYT